MRLPFPERLRWKNVLVYALVLFVGMLATGTDVRFAALVVVFALLFCGAVNRGGGLYYPSGAYIFFNGVLICLLGVTYKTFFLFEAGESNLRSPIATMLVYCGGMAGMWAAVWFSKRLTPKRGFLSGLVSIETMKQSAIGCLIAGSFLILSITGVQKGGSLGAALAETNRFPQFAIMLGTIYEVHASKGKRAWNWIVLVQGVILFGYGVVNTSKEGMFLGPVTWLISAIAARYDFKPRLLIGIGIFSFLMVYYMVPYSQYVRNFRDHDLSQAANRATTLEYIFRLGEVRQLYLDENAAADYFSGPHFYNSNQGLLDRLAAIGMDDALVDRTEQGFVFGLYPVYHGIINTVPTFIWPGKPGFATGNTYGREISVLAADDTTTGISFSPEADAYHEAKWLGIFVVMPLICFVYFLANDAFVGSARDSPWPLLLIVLASHIAPEGGLDSMLLQVVEGSIGIMFMAFFIRYVMPLAIRLATGGEKTVVRRTMDFRLGSKPLNRAPAPEPAVSGTPTP